MNVDSGQSTNHKARFRRQTSMTVEEDKWKNHLEENS